MPALLCGLSIRHRLIALTGLSIGLALVIAVLGYWTAGSLAEALRRSTVASSAAYSFMRGDMMHDALHADVLIALRAGSSGSAAAKREAAADLEGHARIFREALSALRDLELDSELRGAIATVERPIEAYIASAEDLAALAFADDVAAGARYAAFFRTFEALEIANGRVGALIDARAAAIGVEGETRTLLARGTLIGFSLVTVMLVAAGAAAVIFSLAQRDASEARMRHMASHDALTGLPNRILFRQRLDAALARARDGDEATAVLCLDLDRFKEVNDALGHPVGDRLLEEVAGRLARCVRGSDTVARLGGDEFAVVQVGAGQPAAARALAHRLLESLSEPFELGEHRVAGGASIGIALAPVDGLVADQLLRNADIALYRAKTDGRNLCRFFEADMDVRLQARQRLERDLRRALAEECFVLHYQPQVEPSQGHVIGFEALVRLRDAERGMVPPAEFIPLAEETGLILPLGEWVLRQACADAAAWPAPLRVAVNLSPVQFRHADLTGLVESALHDAGLAPDRLELEITESAVLHDTASTFATLAGLKALGVRISMDDFGTGYSSLSYLRQFPFDKLKIDRSFVQALSRGQEGDLAIVRAIIGLGRSLGMVTTAEGVETADQLEQLRAEGCDEMQGYLFSPPQPLEVVGSLISRLGRTEPAEQFAEPAWLTDTRLSA